MALFDHRPAGTVIATTMAGGVFSGLFFDKLSSRLRDYMIPASFVILFIGFTMLTLGASDIT